MSEDQKVVPVYYFVLLAVLALMMCLFVAMFMVGAQGTTNWGITAISWIELAGLLALIIVICVGVRRNSSNILRSVSERKDGTVRKGD